MLSLLSFNRGTGYVCQRKGMTYCTWSSVQLSI